MSISTLIRMFVVILVLSLLSGAFAESLLLSTSSSNPTLNIPRWKMYSNPQDPNEVWLLIADNHDQFFKSSDGGANWVAFDDTAANTYDAEHGGEVNSWIDYHSSLTGNGRDLWVTYPDGGGIYLNKISAPANDSSDIASQIHVATDGSRAKRSNVVATENEVFVITRTSNYAGGNVRYHRYNHSGTLLSSGYVADLSDTNVRIGATLDALGQPVVVIWCDGARLEYHRWNGSSFTAPADGLIWDSDDANGCDASSLTREYAFSITEDNTLHVIWSCTAERVMHAHKRMGEPGSWNTIPVIEHPQQSGYQFRASTTHRGNDLWMFVALDLNNSESQSDIWYRKWSGAAGSWGPATQVTFDQAQNRQPNTVWEISPGATSIPLMYWKGGNSVYTETVPIGGAGEVPDGAGLGENGLVVHKAPGTDLLLLWDPSCLTGDSDYGIYEGAIGHFASHLPNVCTTFGQTSETITPSSGNRYFLIVPQGNLKEGAYGLASSHLSRAPSSSPCREQEIMGCP